MIEEHHLFSEPEDENQKIWRYMDFTKFVEFLNSERLFFARADKFEDIFEGSFPINSAKIRDALYAKLISEKALNPEYTPEFISEKNQEGKKLIAISCWHMNDHESAAMWKIYLKSNEGIAIQSTFKRLKNELNTNDKRIFIGKVNYINYEKDFIEWNNGFAPFVHKRKSFAHENELRAIIWQPTLNENQQNEFTEDGIKINVNVLELVENIYVSPDCPRWFTELISITCLKFGYKINVSNSKLNENPIF